MTSFTRLRRGRRRKKDEREGKVKKKMTRDEKEKKKRKSKEKDDQRGKEKSDWNDWYWWKKEEVCLYEDSLMMISAQL